MITAYEQDEGAAVCHASGQGMGIVRRREVQMTLKELGIGKTATILSVGGNGALRQHFLDMGLIQGAEVTVV